MHGAVKIMTNWFPPLDREQWRTTSRLRCLAWYGIRARGATVIKR